MNEAPKIIIFAGLALIVFGVLWQFSGKSFPLFKLPGDIIIEKPNFKFYFPITTMIIISVVLTVLLWILKYLKR